MKFGHGGWVIAWQMFGCFFEVMGFLYGFDWHHGMRSSPLNSPFREEFVDST